MKGRSLADCIESGRDNILQLRLIAALLVVFGHGFPMVDPAAWAADPMRWLLPRTASHLVGLMMFFTISGLLITLSFLRRPDLLRFLRARALRIWPALAVVVVAWAFVLGPLFSSVPLRTYFTTDVNTPYGYALGGLSIFRLRPFLPGMFENNPMPFYVNSPLWTIAVEVSMYFGVAAAGVLRLFRFPWTTSLLIAATCCGAIVWWIAHGGFRYDTSLDFVVRCFFGAGCIACLLRARFPISTGWMAAVLIACALARKTPYETPFTWLAVGYFVLWFSYVPRLAPIPRAMDLSYGTYLWAWPVQQTVISLGVRNPYVLFAIVTAIVLCIAALSWLLVEKPALKLKDWRWRRSTALQPA